ncbi:hypothetical protein VKT23_016351 [Stygiomarasmius scandens]|uniref:Uncharacterized protein n=1 Tax=Marasmiellus scandens TaxID=2682957 RepID=A0ABR1IVJ4_9AGAR
MGKGKKRAEDKKKRGPVAWYIGDVENWLQEHLAEWKKCENADKVGEFYTAMTIEYFLKFSSTLETLAEGTQHSDSATTTPTPHSTTTNPTPQNDILIPGSDLRPNNEYSSMANPASGSQDSALGNPLSKDPAIRLGWNKLSEEERIKALNEFKS